MVRAKHSTEHGIALISVMIIVALIASTVAVMLNTQHRTFGHTKATVEHQQALQHLFSIETWVISMLKDDETKVDDLTENWAMEIPPIPVPNGMLQGRLIDLQSKLNLNAIINIDPQSGLVTYYDEFLHSANRLSQSFGLVTLGDAIYGLASTQSARPEFFKHPNVLLKNQLMTRDEYRSLQPLITVLPEKTPINVNTAPKEVLMSLHPNLDEYTAQDLIQARETTPFSSTEAFYQALHNRMSYLSLEQLKKDIPQALIDIKTEYFLLESTVQYGESTLIGHSVLQRKNGHISLLNRQFYHP